jgi:hypothetical protein
MVLKIDYLWKHVGCYKTLVSMLNLRVREHYFLKTNAHATNEKLYFVKGLETMLQQVVEGVKLMGVKKKIMQFALLFHLLNRRCLMNKYNHNNTSWV